jgi:hypothetical protein
MERRYVHRFSQFSFHCWIFWSVLSQLWSLGSCIWSIFCLPSCLLMIPSWAGLQLFSYNRCTFFPTLDHEQQHVDYHLVLAMHCPQDGTCLLNHRSIRFVKCLPEMRMKQNCKIQLSVCKLSVDNWNRQLHYIFFALFLFVGNYITQFATKLL